jgi:hypothetical protein
MRYVLIEVESPAEAEALADMVTLSDKFPTSQTVAMFTKASQLCTCAPWQERHPGEEKRSLRGSKYRWRVCPDCRHPERMAAQDLFNLYDGGKMRGGGWRDKIGRSLGYLSISLHLRWVDDNGRVTAFRSEVQPSTAPELEIEEGTV